MIDQLREAESILATLETDDEYIAGHLSAARAQLLAVVHHIENPPEPEPEPDPESAPAVEPWPLEPPDDE